MEKVTFGSLCLTVFVKISNGTVVKFSPYFDAADTIKTFSA